MGDEEINQIVLEEMSRANVNQDDISLDLGPNAFALNLNQFPGSFQIFSARTEAQDSERHVSPMRSGITPFR